MAEVNSAHDAVFRAVLGRPANAASQLRSVLPPELLPWLELERLTQVSGSFVDADLQWRHSDLLFSAPLVGSDTPAFVYVLIEHQSGTDRLMPFRMLRYLTRIWDRYLAEHPGATRLPVVIPLVVHHNRRPWHGPTELTELIDLPTDTAKAAEPYLPRFRFLLDDLARVDELTLRARPLAPPVRIAFLLLRIAAGNDHLSTDLEGWGDDVAGMLERPGGVEDFMALLKYIQSVGETPTHELQKWVDQLGPQAQEAYMTTAEMLRAEGEARGEARGRAEALVQILTHKFGPLTPATRELVYAASLDQLQTWTARALTADTLDQVLP